MCTREGRNPSVNLEYYHEALKYPEQGWQCQSWEVTESNLSEMPGWCSTLTSWSDYIQMGTNKKLNMWKLFRDGIVQMMKEGLLKNAQGWINNSHTTSLMTSCHGATTPGTSHCLKSIGSHDYYFAYIHVLHYVYQYHIIYIILVHTGQSTMWGASHGRQQPHSSLQ